MALKTWRIIQSRIATYQCDKRKDFFAGLSRKTNTSRHRFEPENVLEKAIERLFHSLLIQRRVMIGTRDVEH